ncbi:MAG: GNAT family N-acetyltransferase [Actinomycetota bacterium]
MGAHENGPERWEVVTVPPEATHDLRRRVLRSHLSDPDVDYPADRSPGSFHLAVRLGSEIVAVASFSLEEAPGFPGQAAARLRGMAVDPVHQGGGLGRTLLDEALRRLAGAGIPRCWANARSSALGFYEAQGFSPIGDEFESIGLPHRVVVRTLSP